MRQLRYITLFVLLALVLSVVPAFAQVVVPTQPAPDDDGDVPLVTIEAELSPEGDIDGAALQSLFESKSGNPNLSSQLDALYTDWQAGVYSPASVDSSLRVDGDRVLVMFVMSDNASAQQLLATLPTLNATVSASYSTWVDAWVPISELYNVANQPGVQIARPPSMPEFYNQEPNLDIVEDAAFQAALQENTLERELEVGTFETEGVQASNADAWHTAGITGAGINVAVLDDFADYQAAQTAGELPANIQTYGTLRQNSPHGTAVAEIIYDMAPGVSFTFASPNTETEMAQAIVDLANAGNNIISSSMGFPFVPRPNDGTGPIADAIETATNAGTLYVQAAGNEAEDNWVGNWADSDGDAVMEFPTDSGSATEINELVNPFREDNLLPGGLQFGVSLRWNDWPGSARDYAVGLVVWDGSTWQLLSSINDDQTGSQPPFEVGFITLPENGNYGLIVLRGETLSGGQVIELRTHGIGFEQFTPPYSLVTEATAPESFSIAAIDATSFDLESYSSWGPTFGPGGTLSGGFDQPRLSGFANVDTLSYGTTPGEQFNGTSAATPHVSGAAALVLEANPSFSPQQIQDFLESRAIDQGDAGYDYAFGTGRLFLGDPPTGGSTPEPTDEPTAEPTPTSTVTPTELELIAPAGTVSDSLGNLTYEWSHIGASGYHIYIADGSNISESTGWRWDRVLSAADYCSGATCSVELTALSGGAWILNGSYQVWLHSADNPLLVGWEGPFFFDLNSPRPGKVDITQITDAPTNRPSIFWELNGDAQNAAWFRVYIAPMENLAAPVADTWLSRGEYCQGGWSGTICGLQTPLLEDGLEYGVYILSWSPGGVSQGMPSGWASASFTSGQ